MLLYKNIYNASKNSIFNSLKLNMTKSAYLSSSVTKISPALTVYCYRPSYFKHSLNPTVNKFSYNLSCCYSSVEKDKVDAGASKVEPIITPESTSTKANRRTQLKLAVRDYGATILVFHVAISLTSLGICYIAVSKGVDVVRVLTYLGIAESVISSRIAVGGSTFVMSYAVHKVFAPVRIGITLAVAPLIVKYLRKINWLKPPKK